MTASRDPRAAEPWHVLINPLGLRGTGADLHFPFHVSHQQAMHMRQLLATDHAIQVFAPSRAAWEAALPAVCSLLAIERVVRAVGP